MTRSEKTAGKPIRGALARDFRPLTLRARAHTGKALEALVDHRLILQYLERTARGEIDRPRRQARQKALRAQRQATIIPRRVFTQPRALPDAMAARAPALARPRD